jgi:hypothetical protein
MALRGGSNNAIRRRHAFITIILPVLLSSLVISQHQVSGETPTYYPTYHPTYHPTHGPSTSSIGDRSIPSDGNETDEVDWVKFAAEIHAMINGGGGGGGGDRSATDDNGAGIESPTYMPTYAPTDDSELRGSDPQGSSTSTQFLANHGRAPPDANAANAVREVAMALALAAVATVLFV